MMNIGVQLAQPGRTGFVPLAQSPLLADYVTITSLYFYSAASLYLGTTVHRGPPGFKA
jgi:hypothetical protein